MYMTTIIIHNILYIIYDKYYQFIVLLYVYTCEYAVSTATKKRPFGRFYS